MGTDNRRREQRHKHLIGRARSSVTGCYRLRAGGSVGSSAVGVLHEDQLHDEVRVLDLLPAERESGMCMSANLKQAQGGQWTRQCCPPRA